MFGSLITQPLRIATRGARIGARITLRGAHEAVEIAEGLVALIAARLVGGDSHHNGNGEAAEPAAWQGPAASSTSSPADTAAPTATASAPAAEAPAAKAPAAAPPAPRAPAAPARNGGPTVEPEPAQSPESLFPEAGHVSEETELVEEVAEPGAEEGAGAQVRIDEPWDGYGTMKAADIIDRLANASREELAAVELFELAGRNRKSVVVAAQRALKRSSPPG